MTTTIVKRSPQRSVHKQTTISAADSRNSRETEGYYAFLTELGAMAVAWRGDVLTRVSIGHPSEAAALASLSSTGGEVANDPPEFVQEFAIRLQSYAAGDTTVTFGDVPLDLAHLSPFQKKVVGRCRRIPTGGTCTYGKLADLAGYPGAARAVGSVMSSNRYPIVIPCHRVVGSAGSLGGFSAPQGISLKERMLILEGALKNPATGGRQIGHSSPKPRLRKAK